MTTELYDLQITGVISPEVERDAAISAFAKVLKISLSKAQQVFAHAPVTIKENIDHDSALIIESALARYRIESQRLPAWNNALSSVDATQHGNNIYENQIDPKDLGKVDLSSLSSSEGLDPEPSDPSHHEPIDDVHRFSHQAGPNLSAYHIDELSLVETIEPEAEKSTEEQEPYSGPERREDQRRKHDRRDMLRFEVEVKKNDRRKKDRRKSDSMWTKNYDI
jgi:hypothetical protein